MGESFKTPGLDTPNPSIPSPLASLDFLKSWFENHTACVKWTNI